MVVKPGLCAWRSRPEFGGLWIFKTTRPGLCPSKQALQQCGRCLGVTGTRQQPTEGRTNLVMGSTAVTFTGSCVELTQNTAAGPGVGAGGWVQLPRGDLSSTGSLGMQEPRPGLGGPGAPPLLPVTAVPPPAIPLIWSRLSVHTETSLCVRRQCP